MQQARTRTGPIVTHQSRLGATMAVFDLESLTNLAWVQPWRFLIWRCTLRSVSSNS